MSNEERKLPVFRVVDGERVPVPGNARDLTRRYHHVSNVQTGEQYLLEFTEGEEHQRDEEEAKWEEERPLREAEERRQREEFARFRDSLVYEERIVAFIDVLGWRDAIAESAKYPEKVQDLGVALNSLSLVSGIITGKSIPRTRPELGWPGNPQVTQFSDSILLSIDADRFAETNLHQNLRSLMMLFQLAGLFVRGGVTVGPLIHRDNMAFGPALIRAHELECKIAVFPRIILDRPLSDAWGVGPGVQDRHGNFLGHMKHWRRDNDGWSFLDFLQPIVGPPGIDRDTKSLNAEMMQWRDLISGRLKQFRGSPRVGPKYEWLALYFNTVTHELPACTLDPIPV